MREREATITLANIFEIHEYALIKWGGLPGTRDEATLYHLIHAIEREHKPVRQAAIILHTVAVEHPFFDGNKRTAFLAADFQLGMNGKYIMVAHDEGLTFMIAVASNKKIKKEVEKWLNERVLSLTQ